MNFAKKFPQKKASLEMFYRVLNAPLVFYRIVILRITSVGGLFVVKL